MNHRKKRNMTRMWLDAAEGVLKMMGLESKMANDRIRHDVDITSMAIAGIPDDKHINYLYCSTQHRERFFFFGHIVGSA